MASWIIRCTVGVAFCWSMGVHAEGWEYQYAEKPQQMHMAVAPATTGARGTSEIVTYTCFVGSQLCAWALSIAQPCRPGDVALGVITSPRVVMPDTGQQAATILRCGGANSGLPRTFVYLVLHADVMAEVVRVNGPVVMRTSGKPTIDVRIDFAGAENVVARVNRGHQVQ